MSEGFKSWRVALAENKLGPEQLAVLQGMVSDGEGRSGEAGLARQRDQSGRTYVWVLGLIDLSEFRVEVHQSLFQLDTVSLISRGFQSVQRTSPRQQQAFALRTTLKLNWRQRHLRRCFCGVFTRADLFLNGFAFPATCHREIIKAP